MKKLLALMVVLVILGGCSFELHYKDKRLPVEQVEEMIENELELENPGMNLDVSIYQDGE